MEIESIIVIKTNNHLYQKIKKKTSYSYLYCLGLFLSKLFHK